MAICSRKTGQDRTLYLMTRKLEMSVFFTQITVAELNSGNTHTVVSLFIRQEAICR
jgi:hypothetical protein